MIKSALLGMSVTAVVATTAAAQPYYPYYSPGYSYSYPGYSYPTYNYPYGYSSYYGWPYSYQAPSYRPAPAYSDPYIAARPYSGGAGPKASGHVGY
jgi:hypothetical protein